MRISGVTIPENKRLEVALTYVYGIGRSRARLVLEKAGIDVSDVALRRVPGGVYSEDVEIWLAHFCDGDFGHFGPGRIIQLFDKGRRICREIVAEEHERKPELLMRILGVLKFNEEEIRFVLGATDLPTA